MRQYQIVHAYRSVRDGQQFGPWKPGDVVELTEADAEWLRRDSPGVLLDMPGPAVVAGPGRQKQPGRDRQHRGGANRSDS